MDLNLGKYNKTLVALLAAFGVVGASLAETANEAAGHLTTNELIAIGSAFAGVFAVYQVRNKK